MTLAFDLDSSCGRYTTYRDLIECGDTWEKFASLGKAIDNVPRQRETLGALVRLCTVVLDPVIEALGPIELTYGLACDELAKTVVKTVGRVAPTLDQHASHEQNSKGSNICPRGGAAADFIVKSRSSLDLAKWVSANTNFDRIYYYGQDLPIHVSAAEAPVGEIVVMKTGPSGRRIPVLTEKRHFSALRA